MAKLESTFRNMVLSLFIIAIFASLALATVYSLTKKPIETSKTIKQQQAIKEVIPNFKRLGAGEKIATVAGDSLTIFNAFGESEEFVGAAVETISHSGYGGDIKLMVGFDKEGNIINYSVLEHAETPGLGSKMGDWFKTDIKNQLIIGKNPSKNNLTVTKDGGEVDAITASTITSRAFLGAVNDAYKAYAIRWKESGDTINAWSGATQTHVADSIKNELKKTNVLYENKK